MFIQRARLIASAITVSVPFVMGTPALGAECHEISFPDNVEAAGTSLVLNGMGIRKATMMKVKVYVAGLYLPQKSGDADQILGSDQAWRLALQFVRDIDASDFTDTIDEGFEKVAGDKLDGLRPRIEALKSQMVDIKEGQYLTYTYDPKEGLIVDVNGKPGAAIKGFDFAAAYLKISIGPEPPNKDLKSGLLGGKCE